MTILFRTAVTEVGPEARDLLAEGILILFAAGAPPELAEVSVLHRTLEEPTQEAPTRGSRIRIGAVDAALTGVGDYAWSKIRDIGHVVINFNGADVPDRPGEICAEPVASEALLAALTPAAEITILS